MPRYEYRCRACGDTFEVTRPMSESSAACACPAGHDDTVKLLSTVAVGGPQCRRWPGRRAHGWRRWLLWRSLRLRLTPAA
jgi:putative FmdB family regulatory protein